MLGCISFEIILSWLIIFGLPTQCLVKEMVKAIGETSITGMQAIVQVYLGYKWIKIEFIIFLGKMSDSLELIFLLCKYQRTKN